MCFTDSTGGGDCNGACNGEGGAGGVGGVGGAGGASKQDGTKVLTFLNTGQDVMTLNLEGREDE
jgi:hypothetical protein